jgi:hypothetical protein
MRSSSSESSLKLEERSTRSEKRQVVETERLLLLRTLYFCVHTHINYIIIIIIIIIIKIIITTMAMAVMS